MHIKVSFTVYSSNLKSNVYNLIKKYLIAKKKKCQPSFEPSVSSNLFAAGRSCLNDDMCSLIRIVVAEDWGECGNF